MEKLKDIEVCTMVPAPQQAEKNERRRNEIKRNISTGLTSIRAPKTE